MSTSSETKSNSDNSTTSGETEQAEKVEVGPTKFDCQKNWHWVAIIIFTSRNFHCTGYFTLGEVVTSRRKTKHGGRKEQWAYSR